MVHLSFSLHCFCCCISIFQLRTITGFTGDAGFTCLDTGKQDIKLQKLHVKIEPILSPYLMGMDIVYQKLAKLFVKVLVDFDAILRMLHAER